MKLWRATMTMKIYVRGDVMPDPLDVAAAFENEVRANGILDERAFSVEEATEEMSRADKWINCIPWVAEGGINRETADFTCAEVLSGFAERCLNE